MGRRLRATVATLGRLGHVLTAVHPAIAVTIGATTAGRSLPLLAMLHTLMLGMLRAGLSARLRLAHLMLGMGVGGRGGRRGLGKGRRGDRKRERESDDLHETCSV